MDKRTHKHFLLAGAALLLIAVACGTETPAPADTPPPAAGGGERPTRLPRPAATSTPVPDVEGPGGCTLNSAFVEDVTVPDGTEFAPGAAFAKSWRLRNSGSCPWTAGTRLVLHSGDQLGGPAAAPLDRPVAPGEGIVASVDLVAPPSPGTYRGNWQLESPQGTRFGSVVYVDILVASGATSAPAPTAAATSAPGSIDLRISAVTFDPAIPIAATSFDVRAMVHNDSGRPFTNVVLRVDRNPFSSSCSDPSATVTLGETTVNLAAGQSLPVDVQVQTDPAWEYRICVKIDPDDAIEESDESNNTLGEPIQVGTRTLISLDAGNSGSSSSNTARPGDDASDQRVIGYLSWDLSAIPANAEILSASIEWGTQCFRGGDVGDCTGNRDPFPSLGNLEIKAYYYGSLNNPPAVVLNPSLVPLLATYTMQPAGSLDVTDAVADDFAGGDPFQLRLAFENATDNNGIGNGLSFPEGSGPNSLEVIHIP